MTVPAQPKIYHIVHEDRLSSVIQNKELLCDAEIARYPKPGKTIGIEDIKARRLRLPLSSHPGLQVGECVPFYFWPRSVMLYVIHKANHSGLTYHGGQDPIVHLEFDLHQVVTWADKHDRRWAFTLSNAGSSYFEDRCDLAQLNEIDWPSVRTNQWSDPDVKEHKQAEFLVEASMPWCLVECIGVRTQATYAKVEKTLTGSTHEPTLRIIPSWYY